ncbi:MAG: alpha/beta hydrolase family protein [Anaerocolumna sp.]
MAKFNCNFISYTLIRTVDVTVIIPSPTIPESMAANSDLFKKVDSIEKNQKFKEQVRKFEAPSHTKKEKYPVLYLLHGYGNNHATWSGYTNIELFAEERNIAVVMISAENKSYVNHVSGDRFYDFIQKELPEFVCGMFPVSERPEDTYIAGLSMGGFGTFVHAFNQPWRFAAMGAFSAAVSLDPAVLAGGENRPIEDNSDPRKLAKKLYEEKRKTPKIFIACGVNDHLYDSNVFFKDELIAMKQDVTWVSVPGYGHEWRFWNEIIEKFLDWIPRSDFYSNKGKRQI